MAAIRQLGVFFILVVTLFHFGHSYKYTDHDIDEYSQRIKSLIYPKDQRERYPYDHRKHTPQIYFDVYTKPHNDEYSPRDKLEKPASKGQIGSSELAKNVDKYTKNDDEKYDKSDKVVFNSEHDSKYDIENKSKEWYGPKDESITFASEEKSEKDVINKDSHEEYDKNDEVKIDSRNDGYRGDEPTGIPEHESEISSKENKPGHEIDLPSPITLTDKIDSKDIPIGQVDSAFSVDDIHNENNNNSPLLNTLEESVKPLQNLPEILEPNLLDNKPVNVAPELPLSNQKSDGFNSIVSNANSDPTFDLNNIPSVSPFDIKNNGILYSNGFYNDKNSPFNSLPYLYNILALTMPNINSPTNFAPNSYFNSYFRFNSGFDIYQNLNQQQYQLVQLSNGQVVYIPTYWPIYQPTNPYIPNVGRGQGFQPNNQIYPGQNILPIQNFSGIPGSTNRQSIVPGIQDVPRWLWYNNQNIPNGQDNIDVKSDNNSKLTNQEGFNPGSNTPQSYPKDWGKDDKYIVWGR